MGGGRVSSGDENKREENSAVTQLKSHDNLKGENKVQWTALRGASQHGNKKQRRGGCFFFFAAVEPALSPLSVHSHRESSAKYRNTETHAGAVAISRRTKVVVTIFRGL